MTFKEYFMLALVAFGALFYAIHAFLFGLIVNAIQLFMIWQLTRENNKLKQAKSDSEKIL